MRSRHSDKEVESALRYAELRGWTVLVGRSHWAIIRCPERSPSGCQASVWSTPRSPVNHARQIRRAVDRCPHRSRSR
ncbi:MAG: hypothetical protein E6J00_04265 [Chloroflexi bacterium]|nr:MAG: hypothetical protein E6J00_04265 [Chloroflexota bacterium]